MKTFAVIALLTMSGAALAETPADQPIKVYKGGKLFIYDSARQAVPHCPAQSAAENCQTPSEMSKPEAEKKPVLKGVG
ncbi:MAG TPA: hypothetical protein VK515_02640 [Rhizomicrobium sp.]|nr:hypothetical protein [Rhizomicrobium sp.]